MTEPYHLPHVDALIAALEHDIGAGGLTPRREHRLRAALRHLDRARATLIEEDRP